MRSCIWEVLAVRRIAIKLFLRKMADLIVQGEVLLGVILVFILWCRSGVCFEAATVHCVSVVHILKVFSLNFLYPQIN